MNDIERNNKTVLELIDILIRSSLDIQRVKELVNLKKELIESPQPEGYQGLNKWYVTEKGNIIYAVSINEFSGYGLLKSERKWCTGFSLQKSNIQRLATEPEIKEAILKGCEQNGIVEGAKVKSLLSNELFSFNDGKIKISDNGDLIYYVKNVSSFSFLIFDNGKFAEVVKEENNHRCTKDGTTAVCDKCFNARNNSKPSDKELLKECLELLKESNHHIPIKYPMTKRSVDNLITKLKEHLNHD